MLIPALGQTDTVDYSLRDTTEPEVSETVFRQRNQTALQSTVDHFTHPDPIGLTGETQPMSAYTN
ncbi:hypothetical protein [Snodgrassella sp. ESL0323]|uniref:hypothetical protein n=1 Tax=Snodgrassella sp. ESL0323 TaxID=2705034 RepID=UPI001932DAAF|nr:hypothetical protein [Snodgrassella sp. ESL0323]